MSERTCEQVTLEAADPLTFSQGTGGEEGGEAEPMAERPARLLEAGDYPDKGLTLTAADLDALAVQFGEEGAPGVPVKVEHVDSPLDPLGSVRRVWREGNALLATLAFPTDLAAFLRRRGAAKLSVGLTRDPLRLREVSLVLKPRVPSATLMSGAQGGGEETVSAVQFAEGVEVVRLRAELASRDVEAHLAAFKAQGRIVPASEGPARVLLAATGEALRAGLRAALAEAGFEVQVPGEPPMFDAILTAAPVQDYRGALAGDAGLSRAFNALLRERGVFKSAGKLYVSLAHDEADVGLAVAAFRDAAQALRAAQP